MTVTVGRPPAALNVMLPALLVTVIPVPAVKADRANPVPLPISSWPLVGVDDSPVPPCETRSAFVSVRLVAEKLVPVSVVMLADVEVRVVI